MEDDHDPNSEYRKYRQGVIITDLIEVMKKHYESDVENTGAVVTDITMANITATVAFICYVFQIPTPEIAEEFIALYTQDMRLAFEQYFNDINRGKRRK
jgi:hypothetical protein